MSMRNFMGSRSPSQGVCRCCLYPGVERDALNSTWRLASAECGSLVVVGPISLGRIPAVAYVHCVRWQRQRRDLMHRVSCWALALVAALAGCGSEPTRDIFSVDGLVRGTITAAAGGPVADAWVAIEGAYPHGNGNFEPLYDSVRADAGGRYLGQIGTFNAADAVATVTVRVWPPPAAELAPASREDLEVRITSRSEERRVGKECR